MSHVVALLLHRSTIVMNACRANTQHEKHCKDRGWPEEAGVVELWEWEIDWHKGRILYIPRYRNRMRMSSGLALIRLNVERATSPTGSIHEHRIYISSFNL